MTRQATAPEVTFGVLGPVGAGNDRGPVPLKGARQRAVLARLLIARGRVVPVDRLVGDLWQEPAPGAVAAIRTFVSDLRRALEPDRPPRQPARLLVTAPPGYALRAAPDAVDAWRFESLVGESATLLAAGRAAEALAGLDDALGLWRGPAYAEYAEQTWARAEINRLDEVRMLAVERRAETLLALGRAAEAAFDLRATADGHPLREDTWQLLATALYRSGRQGRRWPPCAGHGRPWPRNSASTRAPDSGSCRPTSSPTPRTSTRRSPGPPPRFPYRRAMQGRHRPRGSGRWAYPMESPRRTNRARSSAGTRNWAGWSRRPTR